MTDSITTKQGKTSQERSKLYFRGLGNQASREEEETLHVQRENKGEILE